MTQEQWFRVEVNGINSACSNRKFLYQAISEEDAIERLTLAGERVVSAYPYTDKFMCPLDCKRTLDFIAISHFGDTLREGCMKNMLDAIQGIQPCRIAIRVADDWNAADITPEKLQNLLRDREIKFDGSYTQTDFRQQRSLPIYVAIKFPAGINYLEESPQWPESSEGYAGDSRFPDGNSETDQGY